ncbi:MAG TPA: cytochrome c oxidase subunit II [Candidatus Sulfotelmatobacter sp.]|nr:cytochrome c oxidase subunit II [Candidatus Sulfotelmatobacter sp.]
MIRTCLAALLQGSVTPEYNAFFWSLVALCSVVGTGIAAFLIYCAWHYRRRNPNELPSQLAMNIPAEVTWIALPALLFVAMFAYGMKLYFDIERPPDNSEDVYVVAKQWMWKTQHMGGQREIDTLHVPVGRPIRLNMISQDVIHSFFIPAFRIKQDVLPRRYTSIWFKATVPGTYHLFCAEYCGTEHSQMIGWIYAMDPKDYQQWLVQGAAEGSLASTGEKLFHQFGCSNCHHFSGHGRGPNLRGLYMRPVQLTNGETVVADETYIRESILQSRAKIVQGFQPIMPIFQGQLSEEQVAALIAYIKAIGPAPGGEMPSGPGEEMGDYGGIRPDLSQPVAPATSEPKPGVR